MYRYIHIYLNKSKYVNKNEYIYISRREAFIADCLNDIKHHLVYKRIKLYI